MPSRMDSSVSSAQPPSIDRHSRAPRGKSTAALARLPVAPWGPSALLRRVLGTAEDALDDVLDRLMGEPFRDRISRVPLALGTSGVDPFGLDPQWAKYVLMSIGMMHRKYFRTEVHGVDRVPTGRVLLIANHSGQIPIDGALVAAAMFMDAEPPRIVRAMVEKWAVGLPFVSLLFTRVGQVVGVPENATRLLTQGEALLVFPEGVARHLEDLRPALPAHRLRPRLHAPRHRDRYADRPRRRRRRRGAVHLGRQRRRSRQAAAPARLSRSSPSSSCPAVSSRCRRSTGSGSASRCSFSGDPDDDDAVIEEKVWLVKQTIQSMLNRGLKERKHIFW